MRKKIISIISIVSIIILLIYIIFIQDTSKNFDVNFRLINKTSRNINTDIDISYSLESTSTIHNIFALKNIEYNSENAEKVTVDNIQGDFGIIITIEENSSNSFYYFSGTKLSEINIDLEIIETSNDDIMVKGTITSKNKNFIANKVIEQIKPITIKGDIYE